MIPHLIGAWVGGSLAYGLFVHGTIWLSRTPLNRHRSLDTLRASLRNPQAAEPACATK